MSPHQLYEWAQSSIHNLNFDFVTENEYKEEDGLLLSRFPTAETVTQQLHASIPVKKGVLNTKIYSASPKHTENRFVAAEAVRGCVQGRRRITPPIRCMS
jgi:hypothetical protein